MPQHDNQRPARLLMGISGLSGAALSVRLLQRLKHQHVQVHLMISETCRQNIELQTGMTFDQIHALADVCYDNQQMIAPPASGGFHTIGMLIAPCSIRTMSAIASGITDNLMTRAADVTLKQRRPLLLMVRESPLHAGHLRSMALADAAGAIIMPPIPSLDPQDHSREQIIDRMASRALDIFDLN